MLLVVVATASTNDEGWSMEGSPDESSLEVIDEAFHTTTTYVLGNPHVASHPIHQDLAYARMAYERLAELSSIPEGPHDHALSKEAVGPDAPCDAFVSNDALREPKGCRRHEDVFSSLPLTTTTMSLLIFGWSVVLSLVLYSTLWLHSELSKNLRNVREWKSMKQRKLMKQRTMG